MYVTDNVNERNVICSAVGSQDNYLNCPASARIISSFDFKHRPAYNISFI